MEETESIQEETPATESTETETPAADDVDLTKEPGGDTPEAVYGRRRARELRQAKEEIAQLREENIRKEERLKVLAETKQETKEAEKVYTIAEVNAFVESGQLKRDVADKYIEEVIFPRKVAATLAAEKAKEKQLEPLVTADTQLKEYLRLIPDIQTRGSASYNKADAHFEELLRLGYPNDKRTTLVAIKMAHGSIETLANKEKMREATRGHNGFVSDAGGGSNNGGGGKPGDISKAPAELVEYWEKAGVPQKERAGHLKLWQARQAAKK